MCAIISAVQCTFGCKACYLHVAMCSVHFCSVQCAFLQCAVCIFAMCSVQCVLSSVRHDTSSHNLLRLLSNSTSHRSIPTLPLLLLPIQPQYRIHKYMLVYTVSHIFDYFTTGRNCTHCKSEESPCEARH